MTKTRKDVPVLIYGATLTGIGIAMENPDQTLLIDKKTLVGHEFIDAYHLGSSKKWNAISKHGKKLKQELLDRKILSSLGDVHIPAVAPILCKMMLDYGLNTLLMTTITQVEKTKDGYLVTCFNNAGFQKIKAKTIIDTTSEGLLSAATQGCISGKQIGLALTPEKEGAQFPFETDDIKNHADIVGVAKGKQDGEIYLKLRLEMQDDWATTRSKLHSFWQNRPESLQDWRLATVSSTFDYTVQRGPVTDENGIVWLPSVAYSEPLEAFEEGVAFMKGGAGQ